MLKPFREQRSRGTTTNRKHGLRTHALHVRGVRHVDARRVGFVCCDIKNNYAVSCAIYADAVLVAKFVVLS